MVTLRYKASQAEGLQQFVGQGGLGLGLARANRGRRPLLQGVALYVRGGFVGGRWPRPPSLAMSPQFTLAEADELRARPLFVSITVGAQI